MEKHNEIQRVKVRWGLRLIYYFFITFYFYFVPKTVLIIKNSC